MPTLSRLALVLLASCTGYMTDGQSGGGGVGGGDAVLTIVGDTNVSLEYGISTTLAVKYHDGDGQALAGSVGFRISGEARGSTLGASAVTTQQDGVAKVVLTGGDLANTSFAVVADAADAEPVEWRIALAGSNLPQTALVGLYNLDSQFDLVQGIPGPLGDVLNTFLEMTDDPSDPATFFLDQLGGLAEDIVDPFRPFLDVFLKNRLLYYAPSFLDTLIRVGDDFGEVAKRFGVVTELEIKEKTGGGLEARQTVRKLHWTLHGQRREYTTAQLSLPPDITADHIPVTYDSTGKITFDEHSLAISYGATLVFLLNNLIIPEIEFGCSSMGCVLSRAVDCTDIGFDLADYLGLGTIEAYLLIEGCDEVMGSLGRELEDAIRGIGGSEGTALVIHGEGRVSDANGDGTADGIRNGLWEGVLRFGPLSGMLSKPDQRFTADRMLSSGTP